MLVGIERAGERRVGQVKQVLILGGVRGDRGQLGACESRRRVVVVELIGEGPHALRGPAVDLERRAREVHVRHERAEGQDRRRVRAERVLGRDRRGPLGRDSEDGGDVGLVAIFVSDRLGHRQEHPAAHGQAEAGGEEPLLVMVDAVEDRHARKPPVGQCRPDRLGEDLAVDHARDGSRREVVDVDEVGRGNMAQAVGRLVRAAHRLGEGLAEGLGLRERLLRERKRAALHRRPFKQPARPARGTAIRRARRRRLTGPRSSHRLGCRRTHRCCCA